MIINKIKVCNYKSIKDSGMMDIDRNIFALIGQNNTGKSAILDAIQCVFPNCKKTISEKDFHKGSLNDISIYLEFEEVTDVALEDLFFPKLRSSYIEKLTGLDGNESKIEKETEKFNAKYVENLQKFKDQYQIFNESFAIELRCPRKGNKKFYLRDGVSDLSENDVKKLLPELKVIPAIRDPKNESTAGANSYLKDLIQMLDDSMQTSIQVGKDLVSYNDINQIISEESNKRCDQLSENITQKYQQAIGNNDYRIQIKSEVNIAKGTNYFTTLEEIETGISSDILSCGTGYQSMIILSILETYVQIKNKNCNYILIIEEPEVYLHPSLQRKMIDTLLNISEYNQVLFSTHSAITVSKLSDKQIIMICKEKGEAKLFPINIGQVIRELGIKPDIIFEKKGTIFVEGPDDEECLRVLLDKIKPRCSEEIKICIAGNCTNLKFYANAEMMLYSGQMYKWLALRDADSLGREEQRKKFINDILNINKERMIGYQEVIEKSVYIVGEYSLESLFLDTDTLKSVLSVDLGKLTRALETYNKVFIYFRKKKNNGEEFAKYYQPKFFFEKDYDKFGYDVSDNQLKWDESYINKWSNIDNLIVSKEDMHNYLEVRDEINEYVREKKRNKINYLAEIISAMELEDLKKTSFESLIGTLSKFVEKCFEN